MASDGFSDEIIDSVLVIGGCGLLGRHTVQRLLETGVAPSKITAFDITTKHNRWDGVTYITGDLGSKEELGSAFDKAKPQIIINLASPLFKISSKETHHRCNVLGVQNIISCAQERGIKVLVHCSSTEVVQHDYDDMVNVTEDWPVLDNPAGGNSYAKSKALGECLLIAANRQRGLLTTAIRSCTLFGEGDTLLTKHFVDLARSGKLKFQVGDNSNMYDYVYAGNAADAHILAAKALLKASRSPHTAIPTSQRVDGEVFNISNGTPWPFWNVARFISNTAGYPISEDTVWKIPLAPVLFFMTIWECVFWVLTFGGSPNVTSKMMKFTVQTRTFEIGKIKERLGYVPRVGMEDGLRRGVLWALEREEEGTGKGT